MSSRLETGSDALMQQGVDSKGCRLPPPLLVQRMTPFVHHHTDESLNERFGISYNTWRKLKAGKPVRVSLMTRLETRLQKLEVAESSQTA